MYYVIVVILALAALFIFMKVVASVRTESKGVDDDNPYINPSFAYVLPEEMRSFAEHMPEKPDRRRKLYETIVKVVLDNLLSFFGLILLSPLFLILAIWIKIDDPGPVFFTQKRVGKDKHYFALHKFRSMKMSTPHDIPTHMLSNPEQYITKAGKFLRRTSLDELPQIWEIFRGKMSVIGPRPALWNQADLVMEREKYGANDVTPGLTGWAQINGRDELEIEEKALLDGVYAKRISLGFDMRCLTGTIFPVIRGDGIVEGGTGEMNKRKTNL